MQSNMPIEGVEEVRHPFIFPATCPSGPIRAIAPNLLCTHEEYARQHHDYQEKKFSFERQLHCSEYRESNSLSSQCLQEMTNACPSFFSRHGESLSKDYCTVDHVGRGVKTTVRRWEHRCIAFDSSVNHGISPSRTDHRVTVILRFPMHDIDCRWGKNSNLLHFLALTPICLPFHVIFVSEQRLLRARIDVVCIAYAVGVA